MTYLAKETELHLEYCQEYGLSKEDIEKYEEDQGSTSFVLQINVDMLTFLKPAPRTQGIPHILFGAALVRDSSLIIT